MLGKSFCDMPFDSAPRSIFGLPSSVLGLPFRSCAFRVPSYFVRYLSVTVLSALSSGILPFLPADRFPLTGARSAPALFEAKMAVSAAQQNEKQKALNLAIAQIEKSYGKGAIMKMGADGPKVRVECIPTGAINLDAAIGVGGIPRGRVTEIYGPESSGKTTLCLHVVANAQRAGGTAAFIDAEHALDTDYAGRLGVDVHKLLLSQPDTGEQALEICEVLVRSGAVDVIVIDSVAALVPKAEIEGEMGESHMGLQARLMC